MECFYRSKPFDEEGKPIRGYRQRMFRKWRVRGMFESTEQRVSDQARAIRKNGWLSELELELEAIKRQIEDGPRDDLCERHDTTVQAETVETNAGAVEEEICEVESCLDEADMNEEHRMIVEQIKEIMKEGRTSNGMFKKVNKEVLKNQTERVNEAIKYYRVLQKQINWCRLQVYGSQNR